MRILILEDNRYRNEWFIQNFKPNVLTICETAKEAEYYLTTSDYNVVFLDHDLGPEDYAAGETGEIRLANNGYEVAQVLAKSRNKNVPVIIHSLNVLAAERMLKVLGTNAVYIPFGTFTKDILNDIH